MATFKGVIFANRQAFEGVENAVWNFYSAKYPNHGLTNKWSNGIDSRNDNKVLMQVDERVMDFPWNPPPTMRVTPLFNPSPLMTVFKFGSSNPTLKFSGDSNLITLSSPESFIGQSSAPDALGRMAPFGTNATKPFEAN